MLRLCSSTILCLFLCAAAAVAQPVPAPGAERDGEREHRRAELRTALQVKRAPVGPDTNAHDATVRQLSPIERAEMRQQLRQQQAQGKPSQP